MKSRTSGYGGDMTVYGNLVRKAFLEDQEGNNGIL
jgi:hypothetical protein